MTLYQQLRSEHRVIKALCKKIADTENSKVKQNNFEKLRELVITHAKSEEAALYDRLKKQEEREEAKDVALEGYEEHHVVDFLINELSSLPLTDERWDAKFEVLKESLEHHIEEEEEDIFAEGKKVLTKEELKAAGEDFARFIKARKARSKSPLGTKIRQKLRIVTGGIRA